MRINEIRTTRYEIRFSSPQRSKIRRRRNAEGLPFYSVHPFTLHTLVLFHPATHRRPPGRVFLNAAPCFGRYSLVGFGDIWDTLKYERLRCGGAIANFGG